MENDDGTTKGLTNYVAQRLFFGGLMQPRPPPSSAAVSMIIIMPGPRMEGVASCDADGLIRERDPSRAGERRDIYYNNNERLEVEEAPREMEVTAVVWFRDRKSVM